MPITVAARKNAISCVQNTMSDTLIKIFLWIVIAHFVFGIGYLIYKLMPRKKDKDDD